jgi:uncharacterized membrane protein
MTTRPDRPKPAVEGIIYAELSAWITIAGMIIALVGLIIGFVFGGKVINEIDLMRDLFGGKGESAIWVRDSVFSSMPQHFWYLKQRLDGDELSMIGLVIACYGGVVGVWGMFASMFRKKEVLFYKKGLYTILAAIIGTIITLAASGVISVR